MSVQPLTPAEIAAILKNIPTCGVSLFPISCGRRRSKRNEPLLIVTCSLRYPQVKCLSEAVTTLSNCSATDAACVCANQAVQASAGACIHHSCTIPEALTTLKLSNSICGISSKQDHAYTIIIYTFITATALLVALRFIARLRTRAPLWWDDYSALISLLVAITFTAVCGVCRFERNTPKNPHPV